MPGASQSIVINADPKTVFKVVADFESYPEYLPETKEVVIESKQGSTIIASFRVSVIKTINYTLKFKLQSPKKLSWTFVKGDLFKLNDGSWTLEAVDGGKATKAIYAVDVDFGFMVPGAITKMLVGGNLPKMLSRIKERAESLA